MLYKIKNLFSSVKSLDKTQLTKAREYIDNYWKNLTRFTPKDTEDLIGLPNAYLIPAMSKKGQEFYFEEFFYWDSFFMLQPFFQPKDKDFTVGVIDNMVFLINKLGRVPNANNKNLSSRSQPPFLTTLAFQAYESFSLDKSWLDKTIKAAETEYNKVWLGTVKPNARQVYEGLSRCYDINYIHDLAETESGWDMTPRFNRKALDYLPVCINSLLFKYEKDFQKYYTMVGDKKTAKKWQRRANERRETMTKLMWSSSKGLFYDYNYKTGKRSRVSSLASYYTMWSGLATEAQAKKMVRALVRFENKGGLTATEGLSLSQLYPNAPPMQWAHPNGWAPLHYLVVEGLDKYGFVKIAQRIAIKWLNTNLSWFTKNGNFQEKYNVIKLGEPPRKGVYPMQEGFGWTNAVFEVFSQKFIDLN